MSSKNGVSQIIKMFVAVVTLITLTGRFGIIKAALDHMRRLTKRTLDAIGPAQLANGLITLRIIDEILDVDLHAWTPVRDREMRWRQYTPSSNATTLESKKSVRHNRYTYTTQNPTKAPINLDHKFIVRGVTEPKGHQRVDSFRPGGQVLKRKNQLHHIGANHVRFQKANPKCSE